MPYDFENFRTRRLIQYLFSLYRQRNVPYAERRLRYSGSPKQYLGDIRGLRRQYPQPTPTTYKPEAETVTGKPQYDTTIRQHALTRTRERLRKRW